MAKIEPFRNFTGFADPELLRVFSRVQDEERRRRGEKTKMDKALMQFKASLLKNRER